jgi:hypothetical protein
MDFSPFVGHFFALRGEKMTYKRKKVPCCRRLYSLVRKSYTYDFCKERPSSDVHIGWHSYCC